MIGLAAGGRPQQAIAWRRRRACLLYGRQLSWNGHVELKRSKLSIASVQVVTWLDVCRPAMARNTHVLSTGRGLDCGWILQFLAERR